jgi:hypothetical protein
VACEADVLYDVAELLEERRRVPYHGRDEAQASVAVVRWFWASRWSDGGG